MCACFLLVSTAFEKFRSQTGVRVVGNLATDFVIPSSGVGIMLVESGDGRTLEDDVLPALKHFQRRVIIIVGLRIEEKKLYLTSSLDHATQIMFVQNQDHVFPSLVKLANGLTRKKFEMARQWMQATQSEFATRLNDFRRQVAAKYLPLDAGEALALLDACGNDLRVLATITEENILENTPLSADDATNVIGFLA